MKKILSVISLVVLILVLALLTLNKQTFTERKDGPDSRPNEWAWLQRTYPYYDAKPEAVLNAIEEAREMRNDPNRLMKRNADLTWEFAGPINIGGRVVDVEFNPLNPNTVYAGAATGGVLKSKDKGVNWVSVFDEQSVLSVGDIAIDPIDTNIIYVGTGEANGGHNNFYGGGIFKSTDAGGTWQNIGLKNTYAIGRILVHPYEHNTIYVAAVGSYFKPNSERGVYKSTDAGATWEKSLFISDSTGAIDIIMHPTNPDTLFAAMWERVRGPRTAHLNGPTSGVFRTFNGGATWQNLNNDYGLPDPQNSTIGRIGLALCNNQPNNVYALYNNGTDVTGLYRSTDLGNNWSKVDQTSQLLSGGGSFSWYFGQVRVHPDNPEIVFAPDVAFMFSSDGGNSWQRIYGNLHVDHHALVFDPANPDYLIDGNDGGLNISTDGGLNWKSRAQIPVTQFYEIGLDLQNPERLYGGTQDNGTIRTTNGALNNWSSINGGDGFYVIVDPTDPSIIYTEMQWGDLSKMTAQGRSTAKNGIDGGEPTNWSTPVVMDPNNNLVLYYGTNRLYKTNDGATNWFPISDVLTTEPPTSRLGTITTISVAPTDSNYIYVGTDDGNIWATYDGGINWNHISLGKGLPVRWVTRVIADPKDEKVVCVTFSGLQWVDREPHIFRSSNAGADWTDISGNLPNAPIMSIAIDLRVSNIIYIGSDVGVYYTTNTGASWEALDSGMPIVPVNDLKIHPTDNYLAAGTHGRGIYKLDLSNITDVEETKNIPTSFTLYQNYPNPFNPNSKIRYQISKSGEVELTVYDILGGETKRLVKEYQTVGTYEVEFDGSSLSSGIYIYTLRSGSQKISRKMILMK